MAKPCTCTVLLVYVLILFVSPNHGDWVEESYEIFRQADENIQKVAENLESFKQEMHVLTRQVMLQQFYSESSVRAHGGSGLKAVRSQRTGLQNYHSESHTGRSAASIHNHANNIRTVGMGEFAAVLNGVEFRTRHNDYRLYMPSTTSKEYGATEPIPFPKVPESVLRKATINEQVEEMREYFKAFRDEDSSRRNYEPYFKSLLCYLEGSWTHTRGKIDESFESDRHFIDARTWQELQEKLIYTELAGAKSRMENLALLPSAIMGFYNNTIPVYAQWNFRILCHPLKKLLKPSRLRVVEDLSSRMMNNRNMHKHKQSRAARFQVNTEDSAMFVEKSGGRNFLDDLMEEIPGKDNYPADIEDEGFEFPVQKFDGTRLNAGYYHRWFKLGKKDAMGNSKMQRGFHDPFLFVAATTNDKVAGVQLNKCKRRRRRRRRKSCRYVNQKWSYAIPLEVIYLTPLASWNPYKIPYRGTFGRPDNAKDIMKANGRNGGCTERNAYNGTTSKMFYQTPVEFFGGKSMDRSRADTTAKKGVCFLNQEGEVVRVQASGTRVLLPGIHDVGVIRTRYPIFPVHGEASSAWKELNALRDIVLDQADYHSMYWEKSEHVPDMITLTTSLSKDDSPHSHEIVLTKFEFENLKAGHVISKDTTEMSGHIHRLQLRWRENRNAIRYITCDGQKRCADKHNIWLFTEDLEDTENM